MHCISSSRIMSLSSISYKLTEETLSEIIKSAGAVEFTGWEFTDGFKKGDSYQSEVSKITVKGVSNKK